jgi:hypothetical protein
MVLTLLGSYSWGTPPGTHFGPTLWANIIGIGAAFLAFVLMLLAAMAEKKRYQGRFKVRDRRNSATQSFFVTDLSNAGDWEQLSSKLHVQMPFELFGIQVFEQGKEVTAMGGAKRNAQGDTDSTTHIMANNERSTTSLISKDSGSQVSAAAPPPPPLP